MKLHIKSLLAKIVFYSGLFNVWIRNMAAKKFLVLMYHRVIPIHEGGRLLQAGMYVEPKTFESHLLFLKKYFNIRSINEIYAPGFEKVITNQLKPACYLTFDDGWSDFYRYAYPLLVKYQVSATVYLPTGFIGTCKVFWTERLRDVCAQLEAADRFAVFSDFVRTNLALDRTICSGGFEAFLDEMISALKQLREEKILVFLESIESRFNVTSSKTPRNFLTWEEIEEMYRSGLVSFGSHTVNHQILTNLSYDEICFQLDASKQTLKTHNIVPNSGLTFCYPNGNYNDVTMKRLQYEKYVCAFSTCFGINSLQTKRFELKRVGLHQDISNSLPLLAYRIFSAPVA